MEKAPYLDAGTESISTVIESNLSLGIIAGS
jgi:hypothetical protein